MRLSPIASGSSGNSIYVGSDRTHLLVDTGISRKRIEEGLSLLDISGHDIDGILITHEHSDHIQGLGIFCRKYHVPIYATRSTIMEIEKINALGDIDASLFNVVQPDIGLTIGDIDITPMHIYHDAADPVGYTFTCNNTRIAVATDLGHYDDYIISHLTGLNSILIESNHDVRMLQVGPYPYRLKQRILSENGHLSNENAGRLLNRILNDNMGPVFLGHLSHENNMPELAYESVRLEIDMGDCPYKSGDIEIRVAHRDRPSGIINVG